LCLRGPSGQRPASKYPLRASRALSRALVREAARIPLQIYVACGMRRSMMRKSVMEKSADLAGAFGHPLRLAILSMLADEPRIVTELVDATGAEQAQVSKHLALLREAGLLRCSPEGRCRMYSLGQPALVRAVLTSLAALGRATRRRTADKQRS